MSDEYRGFENESNSTLADNMGRNHATYRHVNALELVLKLKRRSRIWLCPIAAFTSIPLHAANPFLTEANRSGKEPCPEDLYLELEFIRKLVPATVKSTTISGDAATRAGALEALQENSWKDIPHAECHGTALDDEEMPDEVVRLAADLQFSGFKNIIGMLWEVDDAAAKYVVEAFYENMFKDLRDGCFMDCTKAAWAHTR
ncbi:uncharacterized protein F5147DRAFT_833235 [Suillus discolor]|uniref:CHAT domain-containing protein n=1 Tax=Suillus discolor TaxID=1912936 RepID=A0A9P7FI76_9AGAM|nr:uncharacterized protein F5147DRAFT_833235 [Suillus discolor]KAG2118119.1 hypothetical protein F5147DRAFT_833235 [Suillus discolor]